jgi:hypothetical protein
MSGIVMNTGMRLSLFALAAMLVISGTRPAPAASSEADFKAAYAAAQTAENEAGGLRNQWTVTETALAAAKKAAGGGDFDQAVAQSKAAEALAKASIFQATSEKQAWQALEIR